MVYTIVDSLFGVVGCYSSLAIANAKARELAAAGYVVTVEAQ